MVAVDHPLALPWLSFAAAELCTSGPECAVFTGNTCWVLAVTSAGALAGACATW